MLLCSIYSVNMLTFQGDRIVLDRIFSTKEENTAVFVSFVFAFVWY